MPPSHDAARLADIAELLHGEFDAPVTGDRIAASAVELLPDATHASLTMRRHGKDSSLGSTSPVALQLDELQYRLDEGPCVDAVEAAEHFRSGDVAHDSRWPAWGPGAAELGISSVLSIRLRSRGTPMGALNLYGGETGGFEDPEDLDLALIFATHAALALSSSRQVTDLETAVTSRHLIGMAQGVILERYRVGPDEAFAVLRRLSSIHNIKVRDLADQIVRTREIPLGHSR